MTATKNEAEEGSTATAASDKEQPQSNESPFPRRPLPLEPTPEELLQCQFSSWFPTFRHIPKDVYQNRTNVTIKSQIISPLPDQFTEFLYSDGIRLPEGATQLSSCAPNEQPRTDDDDDGNDWNGNDETDNVSRQFSFPQLNQDIAAAIEALGGDVMPKLNWSTPKDATWVNEGTLKCRTPGDVYLLLKSSDFCMHDLQQYTSLKENDHSEEGETKSSKPQLELVLRKWCQLYPSMEFRCFVRNHTLIGISQRNHTQHYPHLLRDRYMIRSFVLEFFDDVVVHRFANGTVKNYVFDIYLDKSERVWLLDFNVWSLQTDALLFEWEELVELELPVDTELPELRLVETALEVRQDPLSSYRAPVDTVELASGQAHQEDAATTFENFMAMCQKPSEREDGDENSDGASSES